MILNKDSILAQRRPIEKVAVPWLGEDAFIYVRALPTNVFEKSKVKAVLGDALVCVRGVVGVSGGRGYEDKDDVAIADKVSEDLVRLAIAASFRLAQVPEDRQEAIKKNWGTLPIGAIGG